MASPFRFDSPQRGGDSQPCTSESSSRGTARDRTRKTPATVRGVTEDGTASSTGSVKEEGSAATLREEERGSPLISGVQGGGENPRKLCGTSLRRCP